MSFDQPLALWLLVLVPVLALLEWRAARRARAALTLLAGERADHPLLAQAPRGARRTSALLRLGALALLAVGAAGPEWGAQLVRRTASGSDVVFVIDVSASMDARDVPPSRLAEARRQASAALERLGGSRVGLIAFAGEAIRLCPLTLDRSAVRLVLEGLSSGSVSEPGSDLGRALRLAARTMPRGRREEQAIVLWTDGEDLEQGARDAVRTLAGTGIRVFAVGVGTQAGDVVPVLDDQGRATDVKRDEQGQLVRSRLDEEMLRLVARSTQGTYFRAAHPGQELERLLGALTGLARSTRGTRMVERSIARFPLFAAGALLLLTAERLRTRRRRVRGAAEADLHSERVSAAGALALMLLLPAAPADAQSAWERGNRAYRAGQYARAESLYTQRLRRGGPDAVRVNRATARALGAAPAEGIDELSTLARADGAAAGTAGYNAGTLLGEQGQDDAALAALRRALERDPDDADARWNYEVLLRRQRERRDNPQPPPQPQGGGGGGGGGGESQAPPQPQPQPRAPENEPTPQPARGGTPSPSRMSRQQAERLLGTLQDLERAERQNRRRSGPPPEPRARDW